MASSACGVYKIWNKVSGKVYIGSSVNMNTRWRGHVGLLRKGAHASAYLQNAWSKYGEDAFSCCIVLSCAETDLLQFEQEVIDMYLAYDRDCGYNICDTAGRPPSRKGVPKSEETRRRMSEAAHQRNKSPQYITNLKAGVRRGGNHPNFGTTHSPEKIEVFRQRSTGRVHSVESRRKMSDRQLGQLNHRYGKKLSDAERIVQSNRSARYSPSEVAEMRRLKESGITVRKIAAVFGCTESCAGRVINGRRMAYTKGE